MNMILNRAITPEPKGEIKFNLPEIDNFELSNGLKVTFVKRTRIPAVQFSLICNAGSSYDRFKKKGLANLLAAMLDEGAGNFSALEINDELEYLGAVLNIFTDQDSLCISLLSLVENLTKSMEIFSAIIAEPHFNEQEFQREKNKILVRIIQAKDDAGYVASTLFEEVVFGKENPYGLPEIGTYPSVTKIELEDLRIFYRTLVTPENAVMVVVGDINKEELQERLESSLANWKNYAPPPFDYTSPGFQSAGIYYINKTDAPQSEIRIGHIASKRGTDYFRKLLMNNVLGGQFSSRINLNLRENKGYTYGAHSTFNYYKHSAYFIVSASVNINNTADSIKEIINELHGIRDEISEKELRFAKSSLMRKYPSLFETYGQIARNLAGKIIHNLPDDYFNTYISNIKKVELDEVLDIARECISTDKLIIVVAGDKKVILPQLEKLNLGRIIELNEEEDNTLTDVNQN